MCVECVACVALLGCEARVTWVARVACMYCVCRVCRVCRVWHVTGYLACVACVASVWKLLSYTDALDHVLKLHNYKRASRSMLRQVYLECFRGSWGALAPLLGALRRS